jgi:hypothetical protein
MNRREIATAPRIFSCLKGNLLPIAGFHPDIAVFGDERYGWVVLYGVASG